MSHKHTPHLAGGPNNPAGNVASAVQERLLAALRALLGINKPEAVAKIVVEALRELGYAYLPAVNAHAAAHVTEAEGAKIEALARLIEAKGQLIMLEERAGLDTPASRSHLPYGAPPEAPLPIAQANAQAENWEPPTAHDAHQAHERTVAEGLRDLHALLAQHIERYDTEIEQPLRRSLSAPTGTHKP